MRTFWILMLLGVVAYSSSEASEAKTIKICYVPFQIVTVVPITIKNIDKRSHYEFEIPITSNLAAKLIAEMQNSKSTSFDNQMVRLKVVSKDNVYYVDNRCNVSLKSSLYSCRSDKIEIILNQMIKRYNIPNKQQL